MGLPRYLQNLYTIHISECNIMWAHIGVLGSDPLRGSTNIVPQPDIRRGLIAYLKHKYHIISGASVKEQGQWKKLKNDLLKVSRLEAIRERNHWKRIIYSSRQYPPKLRHLIFYRDNYTCQICGRTKQQLIRENLHLEVDHIQEWEDGGETCYENGQTVCSECNKGKHFAKKYISEEKTA